MRGSKNISTFVLAAMIFIMPGCQKKKPQPSPELLSIDLLRGDLILCSGKKFGEVSFSLSCDLSVRETFDLALSLLHSFQYSDAEKAFVKIIDADPECAMAYWGVAMSIYHTAWFPPSKVELDKGSRIIEIAKSIKTNQKEADYLAAIGAFYNDWDQVDHKTRAKRYELKMGELHEKYPNDTEAAILYTLALYSTRDREGKEYVNEKKAGVILEDLFEKQPNHPGIAHYIIHNYDNPELAIEALEVARRYADIAPASSHAQHMPSHIFTRLGLWDESIQSNANSLSAAKCYVEEAGLEGRYFEELHAMDYMVYAYLQKGDNLQAKEQYETLKDFHDFYPMNITAVAYALAAIPTRIALENKDWETAANLEVHSNSLKMEEFPWQNAILHFGRALGASHIKDFDAAEGEIKILNNLRQDLVDQKNPGLASQIDQVMIQVKASEAWLAFNQGRKEEGLALMKEATIMESKTSKHPVTPGDVLPAGELLGDMLMKMNKTSEALTAYEDNLKSHPNRFNGMYGAATAAQKSGDKIKAKMYFESLLAISNGVKENRPEINAAQKYL